jgi:lipopolysaccharide/colanic/teichoic acid biosynthesis glycosyltransferase
MAKRLFDILVSLSVLLFGAPVLLLLCLAVRINMGSPIFFRQERPGLNGEIFEIIKFRTMRDAYDQDGKPLPDAERLTKLGRLLRATSLDELPELLNVLKGEMSLVGPRPLLVRYLPIYTPEQARRHDVRPGITGLAQVRGRNALDWDSKFAYDIEYVDNQSLWFDLRILFETVRAVVKREGISHEGVVTMPRFEGSTAAADQKDQPRD